MRVGVYMCACMSVRGGSIADDGTAQRYPETHPWIVSHVLSLLWSKGPIFLPPQIGNREIQRSKACFEACFKYASFKYSRSHLVKFFACGMFKKCSFFFLSARRAQEYLKKSVSFSVQSG